VALDDVARFGWEEGEIGRIGPSDRPVSHSGYTVASARPVVVEDIATETRFTPVAHLIHRGRAGYQVFDDSLADADPA
jgi:hypothetical protein